MNVLEVATQRHNSDASQRPKNGWMKIGEIENWRNRCAENFKTPKIQSNIFGTRFTVVLSISVYEIQSHLVYSKVCAPTYAPQIIPIA